MNYPLKVWLTTILLSPLLIMLYSGIVNYVSLTEIGSVFPIILLMIIVGVLLSAPALLIYWLMYRQLYIRSVKALRTRIILGIVGLACIWITFYAVDKDFVRFSDPDSMIFLASYSLTLIGANFLFTTK